MPSLSLLTATLLAAALAAPPPPNYDEAKAPAYTLPDPLVCSDGTKVSTPEQWREKRRPELLDLFSTQVYGVTPGKPAFFQVVEKEREDNALGGTAIRKQISIRLSPSADRCADLPAKECGG